MVTDRLPMLVDAFPEAALLGIDLVEAGLTIAVGESCTGGLLGAALTAVAGSSAYVRGGVIAYADDVKAEHLGVGRHLLATHGAVSPEVAEAMAAGARRRYEADLGVGITGVAGPDASEHKPAGSRVRRGGRAGVDTWYPSRHGCGPRVEPRACRRGRAAPLPRRGSRDARRRVRGPREHRDGSPSSLVPGAPTSGLSRPHEGSTVQMFAPPGEPGRAARRDALRHPSRTSNPSQPPLGVQL